MNAILTAHCFGPFVQQYNHTRHDFEIFLENQTILRTVAEDNTTQGIPRVQFRVRR